MLPPIDPRTPGQMPFFAPPTAQAQLALPKIPSLPALPGMTNSQAALPPPPSYPPPNNELRALGAQLQLPAPSGSALAPAPPEVELPPMRLPNLVPEGNHRMAPPEPLPEPSTAPLAATPP